MLELSTDHLLLRPFRPSDTDDMAQYATEPGFYQYLPIPEQTQETVSAFIDERVRQQEDENADKIILAVVKCETDSVIGTIRLDVQQTPIPTGSLGFSMDPKFQGGFYMIEAGMGMLRYAFGDLGLVRIWSSSDVENERGNTVMEQLGMTRTKRISSGMIVRGVSRDVYHYSLDAADFKVPETV